MSANARRGRPVVVCWGRSGRDYSRNRILRQAFCDLGWEVRDYLPAVSALADWRAARVIRERPDLVWVPCFRQRDVMPASRWARRRGIPLLFDPLISTYDKRVFERCRLAPTSWAARRLLAYERRLFARPDRILADTELHAAFFRDVLEVEQRRLDVVPVGAEEALFRPAPPRESHVPLEVLFYGSFIPLQGPEVIVEAARRYRGPAVRWCLLGEGPLSERCKAAASGIENVRFEPWIEYRRLPQRIAQADVVLGIFGTTPKAARVVPNKVYQALACSRPVVTMASSAYPNELRQQPKAGIVWIPPGDPTALASTIADLAWRYAALDDLGIGARRSYEEHFSYSRIVAALGDSLTFLGLASEQRTDVQGMSVIHYDGL